MLGLCMWLLRASKASHHSRMTGSPPLTIAPTLLAPLVDMGVEYVSTKFHAQRTSKLAGESIASGRPYTVPAAHSTIYEWQSIFVRKSTSWAA